MDERCVALANAVGRHVTAGDPGAVQALLAPWMAEHVGIADLERMVSEAGAGLPPPRHWTVDTGAADLATLRTPDGYGPPSQPLPAEITPENYLGWLCVQFQPAPHGADEVNACFDLWLVAVAHGGACRIGYLEAAEPS